MTPDHLQELQTRGWTVFDADPRVTDWVAHALPVARAAIEAPALADMWRAGATWFVGVNALGNGPDGRLPDGPPLAGPIFDYLSDAVGEIDWDAAQVSAVRPGYPVQDGESDAAFRFRANRDAAHLDGLKRVGPENRRFLGEYHRFLLGLPLVSADAGASPLVVWEGSHLVMREMLSEALAGLPVEDWAGVEFTEVYARIRRQVFETCARVTVHAEPGQAYLVHRHALHGISPWQPGAAADPLGRVVAYFRPETSDQMAWLSGEAVI